MPEQRPPAGSAATAMVFHQPERPAMWTTLAKLKPWLPTSKIRRVLWLLVPTLFVGAFGVGWIMDAFNLPGAAAGFLLTAFIGSMVLVALAFTMRGRTVPPRRRAWDARVVDETELQARRISGEM